ncbi:MAG: DUF72 domain-containing protein [Candidatus Geothermarchaeales archaeon]
MAEHLSLLPLEVYDAGFPIAQPGVHSLIKEVRRYLCCGWALNELRIGAGGWAYFKVPGLDPLKAYSKAFNFVEVNSTFYEVPPKTLVQSWRRRVPLGFEFSVRAHRSLTHTYKLEPVEGSHEALRGMIEICRVLGADILHLQTPPLMEFTRKRIEAIGDLFASTSLRGVRVAWEVRSLKGGLSPLLERLMRDLDVIHCVDLSKETPGVSSDILYSRLFGKGVHNVYQFDDEELKQIDERADKVDADKTYLSFHGVKMYKDAARLKAYKETGRFPKATRSVGLASLREVLMEDAKFPCTKGELVRSQGWKVIDLTAEERVHASQLLEKLPDKIFRNVREVLQSL